MVFSVTTSLVQIDAVVTDSKGHYVTGLTADDFEITEDGRPQQITNFNYVQVGARPAVAGSLKLSAQMTPGDYYLAVSAAVRGERKNAAETQWTDFEILP